MYRSVQAGPNTHEGGVQEAFSNSEYQGENESIEALELKYWTIATGRYQRKRERIDLLCFFKMGLLHGFSLNIAGNFSWV